MTARAAALSGVAEGQLRTLIDRLSARGDDVLRLPCPGREKLGDGTVGACASHTADNYLRLAALLGGADPGAHDAPYRADAVALPGLVARLAGARRALRALGDLPDAQLDAVPPAAQMRFVDGERTLEQIVRSILTHQGHQVDAISRALGDTVD